MIVVDASVIIAFLDGTDSHHRRAVAALTTASSERLIVPASAYAEILVGVFRRGASAISVVDEILTELAMHVEPITAEIARRAAALRAAHRGLRLPDALGLATGDVLAAVSVLTADRLWPRVSRRARLV